LRKDGRSQRELANNLPANAADCVKAVHDGRYASERAFRQVFPRPDGSGQRHDPAATLPGIVQKPADFSPVNPRI